jgi:HAD superfamily hydrolase (TIGR01509 family)
MRQRTPEIDLFITDWDGTIWDSLNWFLRLWEATFSILAPGTQPPSEETYRSTFKNPWQFGYENGIPASVSEEEMRRVWKDWMNKNPLSGAIIPGTLELLQGLRMTGIITAIVSATPEPYASFETRLRREGINDLFDAIALNANPRKTDAIERTLEKFGVRPERAIYCDDTDQGIEDAAEAGVRTIGMVSLQAHNTAWRIEDAKPDFPASSLYEVAEIVNNIGL